MRKTSWRLIGALAAVAAITVAVGWWTWPIVQTLPSYGEGNPSNSEYATGGSQCQPSALASIGDPVERARQADACSKEAEEYRQQTADLIQQTRSANAAEAQAGISSQELWFAWLQTVGGFLTLAAAVGAAIYARDAAKHTRDANDIAHSVQRAWVTLTAHPKLMRNSGIDGLYMRLDFKARNIGQTAATHVSVEVKAFFLDRGQSTREIAKAMEAQVEEWRGDYYAVKKAMLLPGDVEDASIWQSYKPPEVKWQDGGLFGKSINPMLLAAVFYRTVSEPETIQLSWRSWYLQSIGDDGHIVSWVPRPTAEGWGPDDLCVEPYHMSLTHEEYPAANHGRNQKGE